MQKACPAHLIRNNKRLIHANKQRFMAQTFQCPFLLLVHSVLLALLAGASIAVDTNAYASSGREAAVLLASNTGEELGIPFYGAKLPKERGCRGALLSP